MADMLASLGLQSCWPQLQLGDMEVVQVELVLVAVDAVQGGTEARVGLAVLDCAGERLLAGVYACVAREVLRACERLAAVPNGAAVLGHGEVIRVLVGTHLHHSIDWQMT